MTLQEIECSTKAILTPDDVCELIESGPHAIRIQAHNDPVSLGFPVIVIGRRIKIPRIAFLNFMKHGTPVVKVESGFEQVVKAAIYHMNEDDLHMGDEYDSYDEEVYEEDL